MEVSSQPSAQATSALLAKWSRLGIAFAEEPVSEQEVDAEAAIVESLRFFRTDRKLLALILVWLREYARLVHAERVKALASEQLRPEELAWLGGLMLKASEFDSRFAAIVRFCKKRLGSPVPQFEASPTDARLGKIKGFDKEFAAFGLSVLPLVEESERKLRPREWVTAIPWLRLRLLVGPNWRADAFWVLSSQPVRSAYDLQKRLYCSYFTAHTYWNLFQEIGADWVEGLTATPDRPD
jgi:hypothetical protein